MSLYLPTSISFSPYREQYKKLIAGDQMNYMETYNASEGFFGIQDDPACTDMLLMLDYGIFYEFIPVNKLDTEMRDGSGVLDSTLQTNSTIEDDLVNLSFDLNYERSLEKEGATLKANAHYTYYELSRLQEGSSDYFDPSGAFIRNFTFATDALQDINIFTGQADFYTPVKSGNFEAGLKASWINSKSGIDYFDVNNTQPPFDIALSDNFKYQEKVFAGYASFTREWEKWFLKLGLRAEQTNVESNSETLQQINTQNYFELFPSIFLTLVLHSL